MPSQLPANRGSATVDRNNSSFEQPHIAALRAKFCAQFRPTIFFGDAFFDSTIEHSACESERRQRFGSFANPAYLRTCEAKWIQAERIETKPAFRRQRRRRLPPPKTAARSSQSAVARRRSPRLRQARLSRSPSR